MKKKDPYIPWEFWSMCPSQTVISSYKTVVMYQKRKNNSSSEKYNITEKL